MDRFIIFTRFGSKLATIKHFWLDPYQTVLDTHVSGVNGQEVQVAATIFFAFSGGQESDAGTLGGFPVLAARKDDLAIIYSLPAGHGLKVGDAVRIEIDERRRRRLMRLHFAAELVLELVTRKLEGVEKIGAHIAEDKSRIDFAWPQSVAPLLPDLASQANALIAADLPIETYFTDPLLERRCWKIDGFAEVSCGGTHVRSTREVGEIHLKRKNIGQGKERIEIRLAEAA